MSTKKQGKSSLLLVAWGLVVLLVFLPGTNVADQQVVAPTPQLKIYKPAVQMQQIQSVEQQKKTVIPSKQVNQPVKIDELKVKELKVYPVVPRIPHDTAPQKQILPEYPPAQDPQRGLGDRKPTSGQTQLPAASDSQSGLGSPGSPSQSHPGCFIATAAYGSPLAENILVLEAFRDKYLLTNQVGQHIVAFYYRNSPPIAEYIARYDTLRFVARAVLWPLVYGIKYLIPVTVVLLMLVVGLIVSSRQRRFRWIGTR